MSDFQIEMNRTVQGFVAQVSELARRAALETSGRRSPSARLEPRRAGA
jgi:hypothetical protein